MNNTLFIIIISGIVFLVVIRALRPAERGTKYRRSASAPHGDAPYRTRELLTKTEYAFWLRLMPAVSERGYLLCPKVRLEDIARVSVRDRREAARYRGYIKSRHIDFLLCDSRLNVLCGIELDDSSHNTVSAKQIDTLKNDVFRAVGIPLCRVKPSRDYREDIENIIMTAEKEASRRTRALC